MKYLKQRSANDCSIAALAVFLSAYRPEPVEELYDLIRELIDNPNFYHPTHAEAFHGGVQGVHVYFDYRVCLSFGIPLFQNHEFSWDLNSIISVPSKTIPDSMHAVVWDAQEKKLFDPARNYQYDIDQVVGIMTGPQRKGFEVLVYVNGDDVLNLNNLKKERIVCQENIASRR